MAYKTQYSIIMRPDELEYHIFRSAIVEANGFFTCCTDNRSICEEITRTDKDTIVAKCADENHARHKVADLGRDVCVKCLVGLYGKEHPGVTWG